MKAEGLPGGQEGRGFDGCSLRRALRALLQHLLPCLPRSRPELEARTMVSASRTALETLVALTPVCRVRRTRRAAESPRRNPDAPK